MKPQAKNHLEAIIGQPACELQGYDCEGYYPIINTDGKIVAHYVDGEFADGYSDANTTPVRLTDPIFNGREYETVAEGEDFDALLVI